MAEQTTQPNAPTGSRSTTLIKADQIEGLSELIQAQVQEVLRKEVKSAPEDMDQLRRSPAGTMIRLEEQVKALDMKMEQRFEVVNQRFEVVDERFKALDEKMDQRFQAVDHRFEAVDEKIDGLRSETNQRFDSLKSEMNQRFDSIEKRFTLLQWAVGLIYPILLTLLGKLFLMK